jgi:hypothetical protein
MRIVNPPALGYKLDDVMHPIAAREIGDDLRAYPIGIPPRAGEYRSSSAGIPSAVDLAFPTSTTGTIQTVPRPTPMPVSGGIPAAGDAVVAGAELAVCRTMWPSYPCDELGGQGWRVLVLSATPTTSTIRFTHARHRGRRYEDIQVQTSSLMLIKPLDTLDQQGP